MEAKTFWGSTSDCIIYDIGVLLAYAHEYMIVDRNSKAWELLHELFMHALPYDPFEHCSD